MKLERLNNTKRNTLMGFINRATSLLLPFISRTAILYWLGNEYLGLSSLFSSILNVLSLAELGLGSAIVFSMYKPIADDDNKSISALLNFYQKVYKYIGLVILLLSLVFLPFLNVIIKGEYPSTINIYILYVLYIVNTIMSYLLFAYRGSLLSAFQRTDIQSNISTIVAIIQFIIQTACLYFFRNYYIFMLITVFMTILNNILILISTKKMFPDIRCEGDLAHETRHEIWIKLKALIFHKFGGIIANTFDNIVISAFLGLTKTAIYNNYYYIYNGIA